MNRQPQREDIEMGVMNRGYSHDEDQDSSGRGRSSSQEEETRSPRNVCWYTFTRVLSALLIIGNVILDWLQYADIDQPITDITDKLSDVLHGRDSSQTTSDPTPKNSSYCTDDSQKDELTKKFMYFSIAGSVLSAFQLIKIIYQIVLNHKRDPTEKIPDKIDGKIEVFFTTLFVEIPQNYLLLKYDNIICFNCEIGWDGKKIKRFLNGLTSEIASVWRYITSSKCCDGSGGVVKHHKQVQKPKKSSDECGCCLCRFCGALCIRYFWYCLECWFPCVIICHGYQGYTMCSHLTYNSGFFWWRCCPCCNCCQGSQCESCQHCFDCENCCKCDDCCTCCDNCENCCKCCDNCCTCCDNCCTCGDSCCTCSDLSCGECLIESLLSIVRFFGGITTTVYTAMYILRVLEYFCVTPVFAAEFVRLMDTAFSWILS